MATQADSTTGAGVLPPTTDVFAAENFFLLRSHPSRMAKIIAHLDAYRRVANVPGVIIECGVFKGASFMNFLAFRQLMGPPGRKVIGFDTFGKFPETSFAPDEDLRGRFIEEAGDQSINKADLMEIISNKKMGANVELVEGDIRETLPQYVADHPDLQVALLNLDTDIYEPATVILRELWPRMAPGGLLLLDDYGVFPGETKAVDEYFGNNMEVVIEQLPYRSTPRIIQKQ
eukprot:jgi/Mesvir1/5147/Mv15290-RA.1